IFLKLSGLSIVKSFTGILSDFLSGDLELTFLHLMRTYRVSNLKYIKKKKN
ncbi:unnamed protein product, partial [marine sediment metagenome]